MAQSMVATPDIAGTEDCTVLVTQLTGAEATTTTPDAARLRATTRVQTLNTEPPDDGTREHTEPWVDLTKLVAAIPTAVDKAMQKTLPRKYTPELASQIAKDMIARLTGAKCPVYEDCTDTDPGHYDHFSRFEVVDDADASTLIDAGMVANSGSDMGAIVYLQNSEFTDTTVLRAKTDKVRDLLDRVERMGDRVLGVDAHALDAMDERIKDDLARLVSLIAYRRRTAITLTSGRSEFTEAEAAQESEAAFGLATMALDAALAATPTGPGRSGRCAAV